MSLVSRNAGAMQVVHGSRYRHGAYLFFKRVGDMSIAAVALILLSPVMAIIAVAIKLDDGGPVFFKQERVGQGERTFTMLKFRTMRVDAEKMLPVVIADQPLDAEVEAPGGEAGDADSQGGELKLFKMKEDPRIIRSGKLLRQCSLDELPQLFNVLIGQMSLIGPRPPLPREVSEYDERELKKLTVKPGLSGLWQVMGRSNLPWEEAIRLDLYYVENRNALLDLSIFFRTFKVVLSREGAY